MNKKNISIVIILIILIGGYFVLNTKIKNTIALDKYSNTVKTENNNSSNTYLNSQYGFSIDYPQNYEIDKTNTSGSFLVTLVDKSKVFPNPDVKNLITIDVQSAKNEITFDSYIKKYPLLDSNTNKAYTFTPRIINGKTFYYTLTERFEGTLSFRYCIINANNLICFNSISNGVAWSDKNLDVEADSTHVALKKMLESLRFDLVGKVSDKSSITLVSPNGGERIKIDSSVNPKIPVKFTLDKPQGFSIFLIDSKGDIASSWATANRNNSELTIDYEFYVSGFINYEKRLKPLDSGKYKIKVCDYDEKYCDISDEYFTVVK